MEHLTIYDTDIFAVNCSEQENDADSLVYRDREGRLHQIDFERCAENFKAEHPASSGYCIGNRNIQEYTFLLYTSGIKTKIIFKNLYVYNIFEQHLLSGRRERRFRRLQQMISESKYTTFDMS